MSTPVSVSLPSVVESLLAGSALAAVGSGLKCPPLFTSDQRPALLMACRDAFRLVALQMAPYLDDVATEGEAPVLFFDAGLRLCPQAVGAIVSDIIAARVLHLMLASGYPALSGQLAARAAEALGGLHRAILAGAPAPGRIRPAT